jgi:hypothetical protein
MPPQKKKEQDLIICKKGHKNSPNAKNCWVCGEPLGQQAKPKFEQKTNTAVTTPTTSTPPTPSNYVDLNFSDPECEKYAPGRTRCDDKDPSGHHCVFFSNCGRRTQRFKNPQAYAKHEGPPK